METSSLSNYLQSCSPCFEVDSNNIEVLYTPNSYYESLKNIFTNAKQRIIISSLYLGNGQLEKELVNTIETNLKLNPNLTVNVLFDYSRALRNADNSVTMFKPILEAYSSRLKMFLYHTPRLRGLLKRYMPQRANEVFGVMHMKVYIADNDLIITGYMILRDCKELCDFYQSLFNVVAQFSFKVNSDGSTSFNNLKRYHPYLGSYKHFAQEFSKQINTVFKSYENKTTNKTLPNIESSTENNSETSKAFIIPLIQNGCVNLNNDKEFTNNMFSLTTQLSQIYLATGYFNLTKFYMNSIIKNKSDYQVLTAAPLANGFFGSKGFSKYIPDIYLYLEKCFYDLILKQRQQSRIQISEYSRKDWTFHAKGIWYYPNKNNSLPTLTVLGSSNFGYRSVYRDLEFQLVIFSNNKKFQNILHKEQLYIYENAKNVSETLVLSKAKFPVWLRVFSNIFKSFF